MMMRTIRAPESKQATTLLVAVRCRPVTPTEKSKTRDILRVLDEKVVVVLDPDVSKEYLDRVQNRSKEKRYAFDIAFGAESSNQDVYQVTVGSMVEGVVRGLNATVFAYGATGSGKTHTMAGTLEDPGLMVLSLQAIFNLIAKQETEYDFHVTCSYLEVYNEVIYDLLEKSSGHLELREDPDQGITVAGLKRIQVSSAEKILELLNQGNGRRKTESTDANATSSRSHAVLEIIVKRKQRNQYRAQVLRGKLALVDLAGSERASETNNAGQKLRDGANINRSLLALANCINALGKQQKKGLAYVPYRNSKLTRLLKDGLSGNSRTVMVATVSSGDDQYYQTINTLKYADRAKEIKTHIQTNVGTVDAHVADYQRMIDNLQFEVSQLRRELAEKESQLSARPTEKTADDELSWLDVLSHDINENVEERINLQKALFELEDTNAHNRAELQQLDECIAEGQLGVGMENGYICSLIERRQVVLDNIRDNDEAGAHYRQDIEHNEAQRKELQRLIDEAISSDRNKTFLRILSQYRLLGMTNMELQFQMAIRDQIIHDQRDALTNLWLVLECSGLKRNQILKIAAQQGIMIEDGIMPPSVTGRVHVPPSPPPNVHKQPLRVSDTQCSSFHSDESAGRESKVWCDSHGPEDSDVATNSPKTPNHEWKSFRVQDFSGATLPWSTSPRLLTVRCKPHDRCFDGIISDLSSYGSECISPEKYIGIKTPITIERRFSGRSNSLVHEQCSPCCHLPRGLSPPLVYHKEKATTSRHKRRPRSAESVVQQRWDTEKANESIGVDAGSEVSETEGSETRYCWSASHARNADKASALDNDMLRKELSRLDNELQDLKRGMDGNTMQWNNSRIPGTPSENELPSTRHSLPLFANVNPPWAHTSSPGQPTTGFPAHSINRGFTSHMHPSAFALSSALDLRMWGRLGTMNSGIGLDAVGPRVSPFGATELLEGYSGMISKMKANGDRHKAKVGTSPAGGRQMWPRQISDWR